MIPMGDDMDSEKDDFLNKLDKMLESGEIMRLRDVRCYYGNFTGKMVKPIEDDIDFKKFHKGDLVLIYNAEEYFKFRKGIQLLSEEIKKTIQDMKEIINR